MSIVYDTPVIHQLNYHVAQSLYALITVTRFHDLNVRIKSFSRILL